MRSATFLPLILLVLPQYVNGWYLDQSCHKPKRSFGPPGAPEYLDDMSGMVMKAVANAFDMAETAQNSLEFLRQGMGSEQEMKLVKDMFAFAVRNEKLQQSEYLNFVAGVLSEIVAFDQNEGKPSPQPQTLPPNEMIVFCDFTRFKENHDCIHDAEGNACDTAVNGPLVMIDVYKECRDGFRWKDGQPIQDEPSQTDAFAMSGLGQRSSSLQLCQPAMEKFRHWPFKYWLDAAKDDKLVNNPGAIHHPLANSETGHTPIDRATLLDCAIFHEMTHATHRHFTRDVEAFGLGPYGWDNCRQLSAMTSVVTPGNQAVGSYLNAENYLYFALGMSLMEGNEEYSVTPQVIHKDGTVHYIC